MFERGGCVYILTNVNHRVLYTGVTSDLRDRIWQHKNNAYPGSFTSRYKCYLLVYYYFFSDIEEAIGEEKRIKGGNRAQKLKLINEFNPDWKDLYDDL